MRGKYNLALVTTDQLAKFVVAMAARLIFDLDFAPSGEESDPQNEPADAESRASCEERQIWTERLGQHHSP